MSSHSHTLLIYYQTLSLVLNAKQYYTTTTQYHPFLLIKHYRQMIITVQLLLIMTRLGSVVVIRSDQGQ